MDSETLNATEILLNLLYLIEHAEELAKCKMYAELAHKPLEQLVSALGRDKATRTDLPTAVLGTDLSA